MDSLVIQTAIGITFIFAVTASVVSILTESFAHYVGLRGEYLLRGLRTILDGGGKFELPLVEAVTGTLTPSRKAVADTAKAAVSDRAVAPSGSTPEPPPQPAMVAQLMTHPLVSATAKAGQMMPYAGDAPLTNKQRRHLPSYLSARSFAKALIDLLVPDATNSTTLSDIEAQLRTSTTIPPKLQQALLSMVAEAGGDIAKFRAGVENWYDDEMARVSGWYKSHTRWVSMFIGVVVVLALNLNLFTIARSFYTDEALRSSVVTQAAQAAKCTPDDSADCLADIRKSVGTLRGSGLPIGWSTVDACANTHCNWFEERGLWAPDGRGWPGQIWRLVVLLAGWSIMVAGLLPGANFWFDLLSRSLRLAGQKPKTT